MSRARISSTNKIHKHEDFIVMKLHECQDNFKKLQVEALLYILERRKWIQMTQNLSFVWNNAELGDFFFKKFTVNYLEITHFNLFSTKNYDFEQFFFIFQLIYDFEEEKSPINETLRLLQDEFPLKTTTKKYQESIFHQPRYYEPTKFSKNACVSTD